MSEEIQKHHNTLFFTLALVAIMAILFFNADFKFKKENRLEEERAQTIINNLNNTPTLANAVSVYDITDNRKLYGKNDEVALPIASLAKILTVVQGLRGHNLEDIIYISPSAVKQAGDFGIFAFEKWKIGDLAKFTLIVSANDGAFALSEQDEKFLENLNIKAKKIGAGNASFVNSTGLDIYENKNTEPTNVGVVASASDVNTMAIYAMKAYPEVFSATTLPQINLKSESGFEHNFKNTDILVGKIPNLIFSKTGFTDLAGGNLCIIFRDERGHAIAVTVLGSTFDGRFTDMENIVNVLYSL